MFSYQEYTREVKLNIEWKIILLVKKVNLDIMDEMIMLAVLERDENFKPCNNHLCLLTRYLGFVTRKVLVVNLKS